MYKTIIKVIALCLTILTISGYSYGQAIKNDSVQYQAAINTSVRSFYKTMGTQSWIYKGFDNSSYSSKIKGSAYFRDSLQFIRGNVDYDHMVYTDVPLLYDVYKDLLISLLSDQVSKYSLLTEQVRSFDLAGYHFVRITSDTTTLKTGFYNEPYNKKLRVLIRFEKSMQVTSNGQLLESYFDKNVNYYLKKNGTYYNVNGEGAFMKVLKDRKKELKQYLATNKIKYRKDPERAIVLLAAYYDRLTN